MVETNPKWYALATNLSEGVHNIKVLKNTESQSNIVSLLNLMVKGTLVEAPSYASRKIEFIGDSITCGSGNLTTQFNDSKYQDGLQTYASFTANNLNADYNVISASGWGCVAGASGSSAQAIPPIYDKISGMANNTYSPNVQWNFNNFAPDMVVINLGTNDSNANSGVDDLEFKAGVISFINTVRQKNPNAYIVWAYGMMGNRLQPIINEAVSEFNNNGDSKVYTIALNQNTNPAYIGYNWHPNVLAHQEAGDYLTAQIKAITGWE